VKSHLDLKQKRTTTKCKQEKIIIQKNPKTEGSNFKIASFPYG
jgi:hypothetical protein